MEKAKEILEKMAKSKESAQVSRLIFPLHVPHDESSFYEYFVLRGVQVDRVQPGFFICSFKVPLRLTDENGNLSTGAIATLIGLAYVREEGEPAYVSVDMSISYLSSAKLNDDLVITSRCLGKQGGYYVISVLIRNKTNGDALNFLAL